MAAVIMTRCPFKLLVMLVIACVSQMVASLSATLTTPLPGFDAKYEPETIHNLYEGQQRTLQLQIRLASKNAINRNNFAVRFGVSNSEIARLTTGTTETVVEPLCSDHDHDPWSSSVTGGGEVARTTTTTSAHTGVWWCTARVNVTLTGVFLGRTTLTGHVRLTPRNEDDVNTTSTMVTSSTSSELVTPTDVWVVRDDALTTYVFIGTLTVLVALANFMMGCELHLDTVYAVVRRPVAPAIGLACQFLLMPMMAYGLARVLFDGGDESMFGLGVFTNGCSPGGGASNMWTVLLQGNLDLSVTMTFISTAVSFITLPLWMFLLGNDFLDDIPNATTIRVPYRNIVMSLLVLVIPLLIGVLYRKLREKSANRMRKCLRPFFLLVIAFICTFGVYANQYMFRVFTWRILLAGMTLPWCGYAAGAISAFLTNQSRPNLYAIMIETGVQNSGIAIVLLKTSFGEPTGDLAAVVPVAMSMFTPLPMLTILLVQYVSRRWCGGGDGADDGEDGRPEADGHYGQTSVDLGAVADVEKSHQPILDASAPEGVHQAKDVTAAAVLV